MIDSFWNAERQAFRSIADDAPTMMWLSGPSGFIFYVNKAWTDFTGFSLEQAQGSGWANAVHPDDRLMAYDAYFHACATKSPYHVTLRARHQSGGYERIIAAAQPHLNQEGEVELYVGVAGVTAGTHQLKPKAAPVLSPREREVLKLIANGKTADQIAMGLEISPRTTNSYVGNILKKLDANNRVDAVVRAIRTGEIEV